MAASHPRFVAVTWLTYLTQPLAIGGAGLLYAEVNGAASTLTALRAFVGPAEATDQNDANPLLVRVDIPIGTHFPYTAPFFGASKANDLVVTWFSQDSVGGWIKGPVVVGVDLTPFWSGDFPWTPDWVVDRLQDVAATVSPFLKPLRITRSFPRDTSPRPSISVQVDTFSPLPAMVGNATYNDGPLVNNTKNRGRFYGLGMSIVGWCETPEERTALGKWLGLAMEVVLDAARFIGWQDVSFTMSESEDFESLGVPAFLVTANLSATVSSSIRAVNRTSFGHLVA